MNKPDSKVYNAWMQTHWRPLIAYTFMAIIMFDFILGPVFWSMIQMVGEGAITLQWEPLTLKANGMFYVALGAILGVYTYGRSQEKLEVMRVVKEGYGKQHDTAAYETYVNDETPKVNNGCCGPKN